MILSYHPCFEAHKNLLCAGREPGIEDLAHIKSANAVILPQGCSQSLYKMARKNCENVFPCFDAKFDYPGKTGQIELFRKTDSRHPETKIFPTVKTFLKQTEKNRQVLPFDFPFVFKFDWGGEGDTVFLIQNREILKDVLQKTEYNERAGWSGFLIQEYIPSQSRSLRVVVIGESVVSYWRVLKKPGDFCVNLASGGIIDADSDPKLQDIAVCHMKKLCNKAKINLAAFDLIFSSDPQKPEPFFLEINYFFGRKGLGGSEKYYELLVNEIKKWLNLKGIISET
jgi:ribosomal protein S6--L-glutamate ligase